MSEPESPKQQNKPKRDTRFSAPRYTILGIIAVAILVGGVGRWFATAEIAGAVIAGGSIKVAQNRQIVQHPYGGVVEEVLVTEGARVQENDILVQLDPSELLTELQIIESQYAELLARKARLEAERDGRDALKFSPILDELHFGAEARDDLIQGQTRLFEARQKTLAARKTQLGKRVEQIGSQIQGLEAQRASIQDQLALIEQELESQQKLLDQGLAQVSRVLAIQREEARLRGTEGQLVSDISRAQGQITELELEVLNLDDRMIEEAITALRDAEVRLMQLSERRVQINQRLDRLYVRAPVAGIVYDLNVFARKSVIRPADPLMYIVPQDQQLTIEVKVAPADIDQIYTGQFVHLKFTSFSQRTTPDLFGSVTTVSADSFTDERTGVPYFVVEMAIQDGEYVKLPEGAQLLPGMPVEAFIETATRTPLEYLVQPFRDSLDRAFRES